MSESSFSRRLVGIWIATAVVIFAVSLYFMLGDSGQKRETDALGPSTFSRSAIGHAGIAEILHRLDIPVTKSRYNSLSKLKAGSVLVIAEPRPTLQAAEAAAAMLDASTVLLVLPKWAGWASDTHKGWIGGAELLPPEEASWALNLAVPKAEVVRQPQVASWSTNLLGQPPVLTAPMQLVRSDRLRPIVASDEGILIGEMRDKQRKVWVLADPDVIANHGLGQDGNADLAVAMINSLRSGAGGVVFDETIHGFLARPASPFRLLFEFPFVLVTAQGAFAVLLLLWATTGRFGVPEAAPTPLEAGKQGLVQNAATLLDFAGYQRAIVRRYVHAHLRDVARQLHAPRGLSEGNLVDWLQRVGRARAVSVDCAAIYREVDAAGAGSREDAARLGSIARAIHQWKREMVDGPPGNSRGN